MSDQHFKNERLVTLASVPRETDADSLAAVLTAQEIPASVTGGFTSTLALDIPSVQIQVFEHDLDRAREVLLAFLKENRSIDWSQVDVGPSDPE